MLEALQGVPLEIEFTNRLPEPTVIHWHGLRIPAAMDGTEIVQRAIQSGETFTNRFTPPDARTFWYHPHANETEQLEKGLYGPLIVGAADELTLDGEKILVLDDLRVDKTGQIAKFGGLMGRHNGREGNVSDQRYVRIAGRDRGRPDRALAHHKHVERTLYPDPSRRDPVPDHRH